MKENNFGDSSSINFTNIGGNFGCSIGDKDKSPFFGQFETRPLSNHSPLLTLNNNNSINKNLSNNNDVKNANTINNPKSSEDLFAITNKAKLVRSMTPTPYNVENIVKDGCHSNFGQFFQNAVETETDDIEIGVIDDKNIVKNIEHRACMEIDEDFMKDNFQEKENNEIINCLTAKYSNTQPQNFQTQQFFPQNQKIPTQQQPINLCQVELNQIDSWGSLEQQISKDSKDVYSDPNSYMNNNSNINNDNENNSNVCVYPQQPNYQTNSLVTGTGPINLANSIPNIFLHKNIDEDMIKQLLLRQQGANQQHQQLQMQHQQVQTEINNYTNLIYRDSPAPLFNTNMRQQTPNSNSANTQDFYEPNSIAGSNQTPVIGKQLPVMDISTNSPSPEFFNLSSSKDKTSHSTFNANSPNLLKRIDSLNTPQLGQLTTPSGFKDNKANLQPLVCFNSEENDSIAHSSYSSERIISRNRRRTEYTYNTSSVPFEVLEANKLPMNYLEVDYKSNIYMDRNIHNVTVGNPSYLQANLNATKIVCEECGMNPIIGVRYRCISCGDYDLCENCHLRDEYSHDPTHKLTRFDDNADLNFSRNMSKSDVTTGRKNYTVGCMSKNNMQFFSNEKPEYASEVNKNSIFFSSNFLFIKKIGSNLVDNTLCFKMVVRNTGKNYYHADSVLKGVVSLIEDSNISLGS